MRVFVTVSILVLMLLPGPAVAQSQGDTDPSGDSPSGAIYEIPLETARDDAAPRQDDSQPGSSDRAGAGGTGGGGTGGGDVDYGSAGTESGSSSAGEPGAESQTSIKSENGFGSSSVVPGVGPVDSDGEPRSRFSLARATDVEAPSEDATFALLALISLAAAVGGVAIGRRVRA